MVLSVSKRIHGCAESSVTETRTVDTSNLRVSEYVAPCQPAGISLLRDQLLSSLEEFEIITDLGRNQICMALEEALANAFYHGTLELDSSLKEDGTEAFTALARQRSNLSPWKNRQISVSQLVSPLGIWITIADEGAGFDVSAALARTEDPTNLLASGRGLVMMKAFCDELIFNSSGNQVTLVIYNNRNQDVEELLTSRAKPMQRERGISHCSR